MSQDVEAYMSPKAIHEFPNALLLGEVARLLTEGRDVVLVPKGRSMLPFIRGGTDKVLLRKPLATALSVGDIVLARIDEGQYVMHRIIAIADERITLMGDGNLHGTEVVERNDVAGKVVEIITPKGQHCKPSSGWLWRKLLPIRKYLLKVYRKWNKLKKK